MASLEQNGGGAEPRAGPEPFSPSAQTPNLDKTEHTRSLRYCFLAFHCGIQASGVQCFDTKLNTLCSLILVSIGGKLE